MDTVYVDPAELLALPSLLRLLTRAGCERTIIGDPSVDDPRFDGLRGAPHLGKLAGGAGDDEINGVDGAADQITCGPGFDRVTTDRLDRLLDRRACESVN